MDTSQVHAGSLDVRVVTPPRAQGRSGIALQKAPLIARERRVAAWLILCLGLPLLLLALAPMRTHLRVDTALLVTLAFTVLVATIGGRIPGLVASVLGALVVNWGFIPPYGTLDIHDGADTVSLAVFVLVAVVVSSLVNQVSQRAAEATLARNDAEALTRMATVLATSPEPLPELIKEATDALGQDAAALFERSDDGGWSRLAVAGDQPVLEISDGMAHPMDSAARRVLVIRGRDLTSNDVALLEGVGDQITVAMDTLRLRHEAEEAEIVGRADELRTSILQAVSHDLRTPLTAIKASVTSLLSPDVSFGPEDTGALLSTIDDQVDRLNRLVGNLLDMSRLQAGAIPLELEPVSALDIVTAAASSIGMAPDRFTVSVVGDLPAILVDAVLVERALANLLANADAAQPDDSPIEIRLALDQRDDQPITGPPPGLATMNAAGPFVNIAVTDHGKGIDPGHRRRSIEPFQRQGDTSTQAGVGLGLAIANGFAEANGGRLDLSETPGGGLTATITVPSGSDAYGDTP